jgi:hypothetical protein
MNALPLRFEPNRGQGDPGVRLIGHGSGFTVALEDGGAAKYALPTSNSLVRVTPLGARSASEPVGEGWLPSLTHYYAGPDPAGWKTGLPNYASVRYGELYAGIDLTWRNQEGDLEYELRVEPGADAGQIQFRLEGAQAEIEPNGDLTLVASGGRLRQRRPFAYQDRNGRRRSVPVGYRLAGNTLGFRLGAYDRTLPLVIDPEVRFSSYLGGDGFDAAYGIAIDGQGNSYITGETASTVFPGASQSMRASRDVFITKLAADGASVIYTTILAGKGRDSGQAIAVDAAGNVYVTGIAGESNFPVTGGAFCTTYGGASDAFVARLDSTGHLVYSTFLGGGGTDAGTGIAVDASGNAYITGYTGSLQFPTTAGAAQRSYRGGFYDAFVAKLNSTGTALLYSTLVGGSGLDLAHAIAVNAAGEACIVGYSDSGDLPVQSALQPAAGGGGDAMIGCLNSSGSAWKYLTYFGGSGRDEANAVALDAAGNLYAAGTTFSSSFRTTTGAIQTTKRNDYDAFVLKLNATGTTLAYSTLLGGSGTDSAAAIAVDSQGQAWVAGFTTSTDFPTQAAWQGYRGSYDAFVAQLSTDATALKFSTYLGGANDDRATALAVDASGSSVIAGFTASADFPTTTGALQKIAAAPYNAFVVRTNQNNLPPAPVSVTPSSGSGNAQTFIAVVSDPNGYSDIDLVNFLIGVQTDGTSACFVSYSRSSGKLSLASDSATAWTGLLPGASGSVSNSQCALAGAGSSVSGSGNNLTLQLALSFTPAFSGAKTVYVAATDRASLNSGYRTLGTWTVPGAVPNQPPVPVSVTPFSGKGSTQTFTLVTSDAGGFSDITALYFVVNSSWTAPSCFIEFDTGVRRLLLMNDAGSAWLPGTTLGSSAGVSNSQCTLNAAQSSMSGSGNLLTLNLSLSFGAGFAGQKTVFVMAFDRGGLNSGWVALGGWSPGVVVNQTPVAVSVTPSSGSGSSQTFNLVTSDANGYADIAALYFVVGTNQTAVSSCFIEFDRVGGRLVLINDAGTGWLPSSSVGNAASISNSQCTLNAARSSVSGTGAQLTLNLALSFGTNFAGKKTISTMVFDSAGLNSGWVVLGTWSKP